MLDPSSSQLCKRSENPTTNVRPPCTPDALYQQHSCRAHPWQLRRRVSKARVSSGLPQRHPSQRPGWMPGLDIIIGRRCILTVRPSRKLLRSTARQRLAMALELWGSMRSRARSGTPCQQSCRCRLCWGDPNTGGSRLAAQRSMVSYLSVSQHTRSGCNG